MTDPQQPPHRQPDREFIQEIAFKGLSLTGTSRNKLRDAEAGNTTGGTTNDCPNCDPDDHKNARDEVAVGRSGRLNRRQEVRTRAIASAKPVHSQP